MKKTIFAIAAIALMTGTVSSAYGQEYSKSTEHARENLKDASKKESSAKSDLKTAQKDSVSEYQAFKKEQNMKIANHKHSIANFKARIAKEKAEDKAQYEKKLAVLEEKNTDLKKRLDDYKEDGRDKWITFTNKFNKDMHELHTSLKNFTVGNKS